MPQLGSGPEKFMAGGSGFLTMPDYREILQAGKNAGIHIVPEIVAPGHNYAAILAIEKRFEKTGDETYRLVDPDAVPSNQASVQGKS